MSLSGKLFRYGPEVAHTAFISGSGRRHAILVGGLSDGMLFTAYCTPLARRLNAAGWACVQPLLSSSLSGWGLASLDQDAAELHLLAAALGREHGAEGVAILGHSTGCQDAVRYASLYAGGKDGAPPLMGLVLQAPVSDREFLGKQQSTAALAQRAQRMVEEGRGEDLLGRADALGGTPITARRFVALACGGGDDDMFSSDLSDAQLRELLKGAASVPSLFLLGAQDECYPAGCDVEGLGRRLVAAAGSSAQLKVLDGDHCLKGLENEVVEVVSDFLLSLPIQ
ncbi:hypothetical protein ACKKBG_A28550 [Auxenochlorella protothecoides x Auxenochlorella symbiontica]|uniref:Uncharacterized protein n=2 Tax=Auxenochlorella protothecoides TaxID=3075 RepID=A0A1D1ZV92_AUXPR